MHGLLASFDSQLFFRRVFSPDSDLGRALVTTVYIAVEILASTRVVARSSPRSADSACVSASSAPSAFVTSVCTRRAARTSASRTPRPKQASARCRVSPDLLEEIVAHVDALRRVGLRIDGDAHPFCNRCGGRLQCQKVNKIVGEAAALASIHLVARGFPDSTPHTLRRT